MISTEQKMVDDSSERTGEARSRHHATRPKRTDIPSISFMTAGAIS